MKKNLFDNESAMQAGVVSVLIFFIISLIFTSCFTSWVLFTAYGIQVSGINLPINKGQTEQNFFTGDTFPSNIIQKEGNWSIVNGIGAIAISDNSTLLFNDVLSSNNGVYYNKYNLNNNIKKDYSIVLEYWDNGYIIVKTTTEGFYYKTYNSQSWFGQPQDKFFPYPDANQLTDVTIETEFYPLGFLHNGLVYKINGNTVFTIPWNELSGVVSTSDKKYYGGVIADNSGLIFKTFTSINDRTEDGWDSFLGSGVAFLKTLFLITVWNISPVFLPWEINLILIKTQVFAVIACAFAYIRG